MSEYNILYIAAGSGIGLICGSFLYGLGGRSGKWKRRFIASFILAATVNAASALMGNWSPWYLVCWPLLIAGFSMGYGADSTAVKIARRSLYAGMVCLCGLIFCLVNGGNAWWLFGIHCGIGAFSIFLGTKNPIHAAAEEFFICLMLNLGLMTYPFLG